MSTKRSNSGRVTPGALPTATRSSLGLSVPQARSNLANSVAMAGVSGTNSGRTGSPWRNVATTRSKSTMSFAMSRPTSDARFAVPDFLDEVSEPVRAHAQAARVIDGRGAALEPPGNEQGRSDGCERHHQREDLDADELGAQSLRSRHTLPRRSDSRASWKAACRAMTCVKPMLRVPLPCPGWANGGRPLGLLHRRGPLGLSALAATASLRVGLERRLAPVASPLGPLGGPCSRLASLLPGSRRYPV